MKKSYQTSSEYNLRKVFLAFAVAIIMLLTQFTQALADEITSEALVDEKLIDKELIDEEALKQAQIESVQLVVKFKNGTSTTRKGSKGLKEIYFYDPELIESVVLRTATAESGEITKTEVIGLVLDYIKAKNFDAEPPFKMTQKKRPTVYPDKVSQTFELYDGRKVVRKGYEINNTPSDIDLTLIARATFDIGNGTIFRTTFDRGQNYKIKEYISEGVSKSVGLVVRENYILEGGNIEVTLKSGEVKIFDGLDIAKVQDISPSTIEKIVVNEAETSVSSATFNNIETATTKSKTTTGSRVDFYDLSPEQTCVIDKDDFIYGKMVAYRREDCTEIDFVCPIFYSKQWISNCSETYIIDPKSGEKYPIQGVAHGVPLDRYARIINQVGKTVVITSIFPPIPKDVKYINLLEYRIKGQPVPALAGGSGPWLTKDIRVLGDVERRYNHLTVQEQSERSEVLYYAEDVDREPRFNGKRRWQKHFQEWVDGELAARGESATAIPDSNSDSVKGDNIVKVLFTVNVDGAVLVTKVLNSNSEKLSSLAIDLVKRSSGMWTSAIHNKKRVKAVQIVEIDLSSMGGEFHDGV